YTLGFLSGDAKSPLGDSGIRDGYSVSVGLGLNISAYVRTEINFQHNGFRFDKDTEWAAAPHELSAASNAISGMLYFDLRSRYNPTGDVVRKRTLIPFVGIGIGAGRFAFDNADTDLGIWIEGRRGFFAAPRADAGINFMFTDTWGIDLAYQYQMYIADKFGWGGGIKSNVINVSNIMATIRVNF
ncbi:MAG: outer membrane beta-barrel protein, partial [Alphaproteobacteria bacterium]|nr:outer membrane beta-barrel protein [Alphaproteobacteria bacterium]